MRVFLYLFFSIVALQGLPAFAQMADNMDPAKAACNEFNTKIQAATDTLYTMASLWGTTFLAQYNGDQKYDELTPVRSDLQEYITKVLKDFQRQADVSGSQKLQLAMVALFQFEDNLMTNGFQPFEKLTSNSSDNEINGCRDRLKEESAKENSYLFALNTARKEYTTRNGIPLVPPAPAKKALPTPPKKTTAQASLPPMKPITKPQPAISEPVTKKDLKADDEDDDKADKDEKEEKAEK